MVRITPHEMKNGKIIALHITISAEKYEILEINPIGFDDIQRVSEIVTKYYSAKGEFNNARQLLEEAASSFTEAQNNFSSILLDQPEHKISPQSPEPVKHPETPVGREIMKEAPKPSLPDEIMVTYAQPEPKPEPKPVIEQPKEPKKEIVIVPPVADPNPELPREPETPKISTPQEEAKKLFDLNIHRDIQARGKNFNEDELSIEVSKHVSKDMVSAVTTEFINILQKEGVIKTRGTLHTFAALLKKK